MRMGAIKKGIVEDIENNLTEEHIKEGISKGYVQALAHYAGYNFEEPKFDYGIDGTFSGIRIRGNRRMASGCRLDFQLKASVNVFIEKNNVKYNLESKNYNDLVDIEVCTPRILILYKLPKDKKEWIKVTENGTVFKDCAWWCYLSGSQQTSNKEKITIRIPIKQIFNEDSLKELMDKVKKGELV
jgi:hypothetical protein